jgi:hypothetical protein
VHREGLTKWTADLDIFRPFRAGHCVDMFPGLKPRAESYSPFGTKPNGPPRDGIPFLNGFQAINCLDFGELSRVATIIRSLRDKVLQVPTGQNPYPRIHFPYLAAAIPTFTCLMASSTN